MREAGGGAMVHVSSVAAEQANPYHPHYAASKGGIRQLTKALAVGLAEFNIRSNAVGPGPDHDRHGRRASSRTRRARSVCCAACCAAASGGRRTSRRRSCSSQATRPTSSTARPSTWTAASSRHGDDARARADQLPERGRARRGVLVRGARRGRARARGRARGRLVLRQGARPAEVRRGASRRPGSRAALRLPLPRRQRRASRASTSTRTRRSRTTGTRSATWRRATTSTPTARRWGISYSGGHVLILGAVDPRVRAVASIVPVDRRLREPQRAHGTLGFRGSSRRSATRGEALRDRRAQRSSRMRRGPIHRGLHVAVQGQLLALRLAEGDAGGRATRTARRSPRPSCSWSTRSCPISAADRRADPDGRRRG